MKETTGAWILASGLAFVASGAGFMLFTMIGLLGIVQLLSCFFAIGVLWCWIDGIVILAGRPIDQFGRPLRP